jgi:hypothetical protein
MTPDTYIRELERLSEADDAEGLLAFSRLHGPAVQPTLSLEQRNVAADLAHRAVMLVDLREATLATSGVAARNRDQ